MTVQIQEATQYFAGPLTYGTVLYINEFTFIDNAHVSVMLRSESTPWTYGDDYIVEGAGTLERRVTLYKDVAANEVLAVYLDVPITQNVSPEEGGNFPASTNEFVLDKLTYICQELNARLVRTMQASIADEFDGTFYNVSEYAGKAVIINEQGNGVDYSTYSIADLEYIARRLYESVANVDIVADNIQDVITTSDSIENVNITAESIENVNKTGDSIDNVNIVGDDLALGEDDSHIMRVNANKTNIDINAENIDFIIEARENAQTAVDKAREAALSALNAETYKNTAEIWAEGSDEQVETVGGTHSARGWAEQAARGQVQADFAETDTEAKSYIKNKPNLVDGYFPEVHVGLADNLYDESAPISIGTFTLRTTAGAESIMTGPAKFNTIGGSIKATGRIEERSYINSTDGITINSFNVNTFKLNNPETGTYTFNYASNSWTLNGQVVNILEWGIDAETRARRLTYTTSSADLMIACDPAIFNMMVRGLSGVYSFYYNLDPEISSTGIWQLNGNTISLSAYGIMLTNPEYILQNGDTITIDFTAALASGTITVDYVKGVRGHLIAATPSAFVATGMQQYNGLYIDNATINNDGEIVTLAGSKVLYCLAVGGIYSGYVAYSEAGSITKIGYTTEAPQLGSVLDIDGEQDANLSAIIFEENGYVCVAVTDDSDICIHPRWSSGQGQDTDYEEYSETRITIPTVSDSGEELPTAIYGMPGFGGVLDEIHFQTKTYIKRVGYYPYSVENLAAVQAYGTAYDYDDESIFYVLKPEDITEYSIANSLVDTYTANDYGIEYFEGTEVTLHTNISYGTNLKDKLRTDVVTLSAQNLTDAQKQQVRENIGIRSTGLLFETKWSDHLINDIQWLRSDTFSWQSGDVYVTAYNKLVEEYSTGTTETEGGITFKRSTNGFKIATSDMESAILNKYNSEGIAWYYILDTANKRFKLPRTKFGFEGLRTNVGNDIAESLPNITAWFDTGDRGFNLSSGGAMMSSATKSGFAGNVTSTGAKNHIDFNASLSSSTYQDDAPVQERATQMYLYFYVGEYAQTAIEQTAGLNAELFNNKLDLTGGTMTGQLTIENSEIISKRTDLSRGETTAPTSNQYFSSYGAFDKDGKVVGYFRTRLSSDNIYQSQMGIQRDVNGAKIQKSITIGIDENGKISYSPVQLITTYVSSTSGYNIWSNGYCEQWGRTSKRGGNATYTVSLLKHYKDTNYNIVATPDSDGSYTNNEAQVITGITNSSFNIWNWGNTKDHWKTSGYLAEGEY